MSIFRCAKTLGIVSTALLLTALSVVPVFADDTFDSTVNRLNTRSFDDKADAASELATIEHPRVDVVLNALLTGNLFTKRRGDVVVIATRLAGSRYRLEDAISGEDLGEVGRRGAKKISVNNQLRRHVRGLVAGRQLNHPDPNTRIAAVQTIADVGDKDLRHLLVSLQASEKDASVTAAIDIALVVFDLESVDDLKRLAAIKATADNLHPTVRMKLTAIADDAALSVELRDAARRSLLKLEELSHRYQMIEILFFGLSLGSILALAAIGLSITFGVMGVINMAHGELIMIGAYTTYVVQTLLPGAIEYSLFIAIPAAFCVSGFVGIII